MDSPRSTPPSFFRFCGILGLFGCLAAVATDIAGVIVSPVFGFIHDTISALAAGAFDWIQDLGLSWLAIGAVAIGAGLYRWGLGALAWKLGSALLTALAAALLLITVRENYAHHIPEALFIHESLVYTMGIVFAAIALLTARGLKHVSSSWMHFSVTTAIVWIAAAPALLVVPSGWEGAYERAVALLMLVWLASMSYLLIRVAPAWAKRPPSDLHSSRGPVPPAKPNNGPPPSDRPLPSDRGGTRWRSGAHPDWTPHHARATTHHEP
jgi:hypothetical protein